MSVNIACFAHECDNPVIGQCMGYKKNCGRYYCRTHSSDTLCTNCANQKYADEKAEMEQKFEKEHAESIYQEYLALAKMVSQEPIVVGEYKYPTERKVKAVKFFFIIGLLIFAFFFIFVGYLYLSGMGEFTEPPKVVITRVVGISFGIPILFIFFDWQSNMSNWLEKEKGKQISERVSTIEKEKHGFIEFWNAWLQQQKDEKAEKSRQVLMGVLAVVGVIAAGAIASSLSESDYDRTRRAVRDELNQK